jgi:hypothetical protein
MRGEGDQKISVFVHAKGIKTVHAGGGSKNGKILSTLLLNDPYVLYNSRNTKVGEKN